MFVHVAVCFPGMDEDVVASVRDLGLMAHRMVYNGRSAFPGYLFVDERFSPWCTGVKGIAEFLMVDGDYVKMSQEHVNTIQEALDSLPVTYNWDAGALFDEYFSGNGVHKYFETPGTEQRTNVVNVQRYGKVREIYARP